MNKHDKTGGRKGRTTGRSQPSALPKSLFTKWLSISLVVACAVIAGLWGVRHFSGGADETPRQEEPRPTVGAPPDPSEELSEPIADKEVAAVKEESLALAGKLLREFPDSDVPLVIMGNVHRKYGDSAEAIEYWKRALVLNPKRADAYEGMAWVAVHKEEYERAIELWRKALDTDPETVRVHNNIAQALLALGKYDEVIEEAAEELKTRPDSTLAYFLQGQGYLKLKQYQEAKKCYERAIALDSDNTNAYYGLFTVCSRLGLRDEAADHMARFRELKDKEGRARMDRNKALDDLVKRKQGLAKMYQDAEPLYRSSGNHAEAKVLMARAVELDPGNAKYMTRLGTLYQMLGMLPEALAMHEKAAQIEPDNVINHMHTGVVSMRMKQFAAAEKSFRRVIALAPKFSGGYREIAHLYLRMQTAFPEALMHARTAVKLEEAAANYFILSWALDRNGDAAGASAALKRATELEPGNEEYRRKYELMQKRDSGGDS